MRNLDNYFDSLLESAENLDIKKPVVTHANIYSLGVVNSEGNGKRIVFSKALARKLQLEDSVDIVPLKDKGVVLVAKELSSKKAIQCKLSGSFRDVEFDERGDLPIAAIKISEPIAKENNIEE